MNSRGAKNEQSKWYAKGLALFKMNKHKEAVKCFDKAIEEDKFDPMVWYVKSVALQNLGKFEESIRCADRAIEIKPGHYELALAWYSKGFSLHMLKKHKEAIEAFDKAIELRPTTFSWIKRAESLFELRMYNQALDSYEKAKQVLEDLSRKREIKDTLESIDQNSKQIKLGFIDKVVARCQMNGDNASMYEWASKGLKFASQIDSNLNPDSVYWQAKFLFYIGDFFFATYNYVDASKYFIESSKFCSKDDPLWNAIQVRLADTFGIMGRHEDADNYLEKVNQQLFENKDARLYYYRYLIRKADLLKVRGEYDDALEILNNNLLPRLFRETKRYSTTEAESDLSAELIGANIVDAIRVSAKISYEKYMSERFSRNATLKDIEKASKFLEKAYNYAPPSWAAVVLYESSYYRIRLVLDYELTKERELEPKEAKRLEDQLDIAILNLKRCLLLNAESAFNKIIAADAHILLGQCYSLKESYDLAKESIKSGIDLYDEIVASTQVSDARISTTDYNRFQMARKDLCYVLLMEEKSAEALGYAEAGKAREMFNADIISNHIKCKKREDSINTINSLNLRLREIKEKRETIIKQVESSKKDKLLLEQLQILDGENTNIFRERREIEDSIWRECPDPGITLPKDPQEIILKFIDQSEKNVTNLSLPNRWALLEFEYLKNQDQLVLFLLDFKQEIYVSSIGLSSLGWNDIIPSRIELINETFRTSSYKEAEELVSDLAMNIRQKKFIPDDIIDRINELKIDQLMVVADGILHRFPFELVRDNDSSLSECWGIKYNLVRGFSMNHISSQMQLNPSAQQKLRGLVVGNPTDMALPKKEIDPLNASDKLWIASLPGAEAEAQRIAKILSEKGGDAVLLLRDQASKDNFIKELESSSYSFIHFAGHARFDTDESELSYLLLNNGKAESAKLYANEISSKIRFKGSPIVILSSCESAESEIRTGNEPFGLIRSFILAGASNLIISGWPVMDESAGDFMKFFYTKLLDTNFNISKAMSYARLELSKLADSGVYENEVSLLHWAPFQLWGNPFTVIQK